MVLNLTEAEYEKKCQYLHKEMKNISTDPKVRKSLQMLFDFLKEMKNQCASWKAQDLTFQQRMQNVASAAIESWNENENLMYAVQIPVDDESKPQSQYFALGKYSSMSGSYVQDLNITSQWDIATDEINKGNEGKVKVSWWKDTLCCNFEVFVSDTDKQNIALGIPVELDYKVDNLDERSKKHYAGICTELLQNGQMSFDAEKLCLESKNDKLASSIIENLQTTINTQNFIYSNLSTLEKKQGILETFPGLYSINFNRLSQRPGESELLLNLKLYYSFESPSYIDPDLNYAFGRAVQMLYQETLDIAIQSGASGHSNTNYALQSYTICWCNAKNQYEVTLLDMDDTSEFKFNFPQSYGICYEIPNIPLEIAIATRLGSNAFVGGYTINKVDQVPFPIRSYDQVYNDNNFNDIKPFDTILERFNEVDIKINSINMAIDKIQNKINKFKF